MKHVKFQKLDVEKWWFQFSQIRSWKDQVDELPYPNLGKWLLDLWRRCFSISHFCESSSM